MLNVIVGTIGAAITVGAHAVTGYRAHLWIRRNAPGLACWIPRDGGALLGAILGGIAVYLWFRR